MREGGDLCYEKWSRADADMYFRFRTHAIDVVGPLTVRDVLKAVGDAQQLGYVRNAVLKAWLSRHLPDADDHEPKRLVDLIALNLDFAQAFMGRMVDHSIPGRKGEAAFTYKTSFPLRQSLCSTRPLSLTLRLAWTSTHSCACWVERR